MYYFIINPHSRSGHGLEVWQKADAILQEKGVEYTTYFTEYTGHADRIAAHIAEQSSVGGTSCTLSVVGGDGTLNEVINGLVKKDFSHITLGYIPTGSGNDFARGLGLPTEVSACIEAILSPKACTLTDIGMAVSKETSRYFLVSSGIGYDADICRKVMVSPLKKAMNKLHLGKLTYVLIALKLLIQYRPCPVSMRLDRDKVLHFSRFFFIAGMNTKYEGGGVKFCPDAQFNDRKLDICLAGELGKCKILALFPTAFFCKHTWFSGVKTYRCDSLEIHSRVPLPVHCDGESMGETDRLLLRVSGKQIPVLLR